MAMCFVTIALVLSAQMASILAAPVTGDRKTFEDTLDDVLDEEDDDDREDDTDTFVQELQTDTLAKYSIQNIPAIPAPEDETEYREALEAAIQQLLQNDQAGAVDEELKNLIEVLPEQNSFRSELEIADDMLETEIKSTSYSVPELDELIDP